MTRLVLAALAAVLAAGCATPPPAAVPAPGPRECLYEVDGSTVGKACPGEAR